MNIDRDIGKTDRVERDTDRETEGNRERQRQRENGESMLRSFQPLYDAS